MRRGLLFVVVVVKRGKSFMSTTRKEVVLVKVS